MLDPSLVLQAELLATEAHTGQFRKYTGEPYIVHPRNVVSILREITDDTATLSAGWLRDVVEDTRVTLNTIKVVFGREIAQLVSDVTNVTTHADGSRSRRKALERLHLAEAAPKAKTIKLADILDNVPDIAVHDPNFARIYLDEKLEALSCLRSGNQILWDRAKILLDKLIEESIL